MARQAVRQSKALMTGAWIAGIGASGFMAALVLWHPTAMVASSLACVAGSGTLALSRRNRPSARA